MLHWLLGHASTAAALLPKQAKGTSRKHVPKPVTPPAAPDCIQHPLHTYFPHFQEYPPTKSTHQQVLRALVGALAEGSGEERAARFVVDLVAAQLHVQVRISRKIKLEYEKHVCCMLLNLDSKIKLQ